MGMRTIFLLTFLSSLFLISCKDDDKEIKGKFDGQPIWFNTAITGMTRAAGTQWDAEDAIGVFMKTNGQDLSSSTVKAANKQYTTDGTGNFVFATNEDKIFLPEDGSKVDFIAYYPYNTSIADFKYLVDVAGKQTGKFKQIDLLYSKNEVGKDKSVTDISLQFSHKLAMISFDIVDKGAKDLSGTIVTIIGMNTKASFLLVNGTFEAATTPANIIAETKATGNRAISEAMIIPVELLNDAKVTFNIPSHGKTYTWDFPAGQKYESGKKYTYDVEVKSETGEITVNLTGSIDDWVNVPSGTVVIGEEDPEEGDGSKESPYSISQVVAAKVGETGKWVEGYIVGSPTKPRAIGTPSADKILLAATADETDESKCIPVDIESSAVKANLDIISHPDLIGKKIKVQGDIVNNLFNNSISLTNITAQEGGANGGV